MTRFLHALLTGLVGAGIVHIAILFLLPVFAEKDAWARLAETGEPYHVVRLDHANPSLGMLTSPDPFFEAVACRFDLSDGALHLVGEGRIPFWSISVYDRRGLNIYSLNDRTATGDALDFVVVTPAQMLTMRKEVPAEFTQSIFVEADLTEGIVVMRAFVPDESWREVVSTYLNGISCTSR
ncbi:putative membrane protein [Mesorhizobium sp. J18]|uniref:DUF1254 domain-containing protein n=1 Tax=Mesorhizobium sp. J18 TaxID=935263 RepID=UPI0011992E68|nr:DUF1254 domain-containing protein [Mesorhizobium sp. J18]TWG99303.1 putative membrane protein [Mesorhizobium sp. J18]